MGTVSLRTLVGLATLGGFLYLLLLGGLLQLAVVPRRVELHQELRQLVETGLEIRQRAERLRMAQEAVAGPAIDGAAAPSGLDTLLALTEPRPPATSSRGDVKQRLSVAAVDRLQSAASHTLLLAARALGVRDVQQARSRLASAAALRMAADSALAESTVLTAQRVQALQVQLQALDTFQSRAITLWVGVGLLLIPFLYRLVHRRFMGPLQTLTAGMREVGKGHFGSPLPVQRLDELGALTAQFNQTTELLRKHQLETGKHAKELAATRMRTLLEGTLDAGILVDAHGRVREWNTQAVTLLQVPRSEALGRRLADVLLPGTPQDLVEGPLASLTNGEAPRVLRGKLLARRRNGVQVPVEWVIVALRARDGAQEFGLFLREIGAPAMDDQRPTVMEASPEQIDLSLGGPAR